MLAEVVSWRSPTAGHATPGHARLSADSCEQYMRFIATGLCPARARAAVRRGVRCREPFGWMSESMDLSKEKNFFETRVTEYQTGGTLIW